MKYEMSCVSLAAIYDDIMYFFKNVFNDVCMMSNMKCRVCRMAAIYDDIVCKKCVEIVCMVISVSR